MRAFFYLLILSSLSACSGMRDLFSKKSPVLDNDKIPGVLSEDYVAHYQALAPAILKNSGIRFLPISRRSKKYLNRIFQRIVTNNELLLPQRVEPKFYLIKDKVPYIFSLPGYTFFISNGLIKKYLRNESLLVSALGFEIVKSGRNIYRKNQVIPTQTINLQEVLSMTQTEYKNRLDIYKWTYFSLRRSDYDGAAILNWIQTQNKNSLDFSWQIRDPRGNTREELVFKSFLVAQGVGQFDNTESNSSSDFYRFRESIR